MSSAAVRVVDHPAAAMTLARIRDHRTGQDGFRAAARVLGQILAIAALEDVPTESAEVLSPLAPAPTRRPAVPIVAVPVLRAGLGLLHGVEDVIPELRVGMIGLERDEQTLEPSEYYRKVPPLAGAWILLLEPMLATGGSASAAAKALDAAGAAGITILSVVGTDQGIGRIETDNPGIRFVVASVDPELNAEGFIVPGLGDFGDRLFGTVE